AVDLDVFLMEPVEHVGESLSCLATPHPAREYVGDTASEGRLEMAVKAERTPEQSAARADRWSPELIDLSRPLTAETVDALFGDLVADGKNAYFRDISIDVVVDFSTANATSCTFRIPDHAATHVDASVHTVEGRGWLEEIDISRLIGEAVVLDLDRGGED